jgi:NADH dehydrogenase
MIKIAITGATGYIGSSLSLIAVTKGHDVVRMVRQKLSIYDESWFHFDLESSEEIFLPVDTDAVVHLAANTLGHNLMDNSAEITAVHRLIRSTQKVGARFIFVSSQTAREDAPTSYGQTKWRIEQHVLAAGGVVVRPGQVYGGELRGLYGILVNSVMKLRVLPAFLPAPKVQPIHLDDLAEGLLRIAERDDLSSGVYCLAASMPISFSSFLGEIAQSRLRCKRLFVPVPVVAVNFFVEVIGPTWRNKLGLVRLLSLFDLPEMTTESDLNNLGLSLRSISAGLHPSGDDRRRNLLLEGQALLTYILKEQPDWIMSRRYARAIESLRGGRAIGLSKIFLSYPILLSLLDKKSWGDESMGAEFICRLDAATLLSEASPIGGNALFGA